MICINLLGKKIRRLSPFVLHIHKINFHFSFSGAPFFGDTTLHALVHTTPDGPDGPMRIIMMFINLFHGGGAFRMSPKNATECRRARLANKLNRCFRRLVHLMNKFCRTVSMQVSCSFESFRFNYADVMWISAHRQRDSCDERDPEMNECLRVICHLKRMTHFPFKSFLDE